jgi:hypothetical protein
MSEPNPPTPPTLEASREGPVANTPSPGNIPDTLPYPRETATAPLEENTRDPAEAAPARDRQRLQEPQAVPFFSRREPAPLLVALLRRRRYNSNSYTGVHHERAAEVYTCSQ